MTVELPEFKKCCFCLPLRAGLLVWGYIKIIAGALITPILAYFILSTIVMSLMSGNKKYVIWIMLYTAMALITLLLFITDFVATIVFIVGGHKKNVKLIRGFYVFCIGELIVTIVLTLVAVGISIAHWTSRDATRYCVIYATFLLTLAVQAYFILLLRSEVIKLKSNGQFKFLKNSAEEQCMMTSKQNEAEIENIYKEELDY